MGCNIDDIMGGGGGGGMGFLRLMTLWGTDVGCNIDDIMDE